METAYLNLARVFFIARLVHALVYSLGLTYLRTPAYLVSWAVVPMIGGQALV